MTLIVCDVEADGPVPGLYSMVSFGMVRVNAQGPQERFSAKMRPISDNWVPNALAVSGITREEHLAYPDPAEEMARCDEWLSSLGSGRKVFVSDNNGFDWQFVNYYMHAFVGHNQFGFSSRRIGDFYAGLQGDFYGRQDWKKMRRTKHTHDPLDDALGNAEALAALLRGERPVRRQDKNGHERPVSP